MPDPPPSDIYYRRWRAPREDGQTLVEPGLRELTQCCARNSAVRAAEYGSIDIAGMSLVEVAKLARRELLELARRYAASYLDASTLPPPDWSAPICMAGHQPQLFHAGVWFKNFVLSSVAQRAGATAINLIVDNDTCRSASIRVPTGPRDEPRVESLWMDAPSAEIAFEERAIVDERLFESFAERVEGVLRGWIEDPLVKRLWPATVAAARRTGNFGQAIATGRHRLERELGLVNLEIPLSWLCATEGFARFALALLADLPRFARAYNRALEQYRHVHHIRSYAHPVPNLGVSSDRVEAPLWTWTSVRPRRHGLFVERQGDALCLYGADSNAAIGRITLSGGMVDKESVAAFMALAGGAVKLRPRALLTTMFSRMVLSDLFLHGIGGAKYDQVTDAIMAEYFALEAPVFGVVTGTFLLPLGHNRTDSLPLAQLAHDVREFRFHPETYLDPDVLRQPEAAALLAEKERLINLTLPKGMRLARHRAIVGINEHLAGWGADVQRQLAARLAAAQRSQRLELLLGSREFSFCLFPQDLTERLAAHAAD